MQPSETTVDILPLIDAIKSQFAFTPNKYPELARLSEADQKKLFALKHIAFHLMKSVGVIASKLEDADHGGGLDEKELSARIAKSLSSVLNMAVQLDIPPETLVQMAQNNLRAD